MSDNYGLQDVRQLISGRNYLRTNPPPQEPFSIDHCCLGSSVAPPPNTNSYEHVTAGDVISRGFAQFPLRDYSLALTPLTLNVTTTASDAFCSIEATENGWLGFDSENKRWSRQETLFLLEIRSRLDSKFRETLYKGPLWNEVSRIMAEEYGYQRSGRKCKEKFENLYKYYKKTKLEGRQDGKYYRFFHQLEAICGETSSTHASTSSETLTHKNRGRKKNIAPFNQPPSITINQDTDHALHNLNYFENLSFSNSSELFGTSSSENNDEDVSAMAYGMKQKGLEQRQVQGKGRRSWESKVEELVDTHMKKVIESQDAWMEKMFSVMEHREQEMASKEEERWKRESIRFDREVHELWAKERAWVESRDAALMEAVKKHIGKRSIEALPLAEPFVYPCQAGDSGSNSNNNNKSWAELEITNLIELRTGLELRFQESGHLEKGAWDEIAAKMACLGFDRSPNEYQQIWDEIIFRNL
ncbi:hypothetical protein L6164_007332 [Bauhinia variegata]|uniref:Uncharacterized protein n=1 Tax=Bauhinia variegata TaxID=167791 RepID=A0ACB9PDI4_BAUVA|nr:hypothetical protein L6164_007332 [Bauhinia variegata]